MKIVYHCFGGAHTSITCAAIHLNFLPHDRIPRFNEFKAVPFYDKMDKEDVGMPLYMGQDDLGYDIYVMGMSGGKDVVIPAIKSYLNASYVDAKDIIFINALVKLHPITSLGGVASRKYGLVSIGRPMTIWGIRLTYPVLLDLVLKVKEFLKENYADRK
ncbi:MAG: DUF3189 domain-containing protein [Xylanivirga thermophila]|jgi:hypothetical protein|uniref:DUF3189 family protein n=1 Tax=Xylanivirga thermophila TaxID=2496273 RepID=UPI00101B84DF|nr:DUF3189 family protein [Xylanivirga thermophila]